MRDESLYVHTIYEDYGPFAIHAEVHEDPNATLVWITLEPTFGPPLPVSLVSRQDAWALSDAAKEWAGARRQRAIADGEMQAAAEDEDYHERVTG